MAGPATAAGTAHGERVLQVEIRSPDGLIWSGAASTVVVPATQGSMGVLPRHAALMSSLEPGLTVVTEPGGSERRYVTGAGFVEIADDRVLLLVDFADDPARIDVKRAQSSRERAEKRLRSAAEEVDRVRAEAALARSLQRLRFAGQPRL
ncbi:MAG: ATP synthase F1 subunit epsilon [Planctomycetota bacterium]